MQLDRPLAVIAPTIDGDVLAVLAQVEDENMWFTTGQVRRTLDRYSEVGIRKVLNRLSEQGIVLPHRAGNTVAYRLNQNHLAAEPIKVLTASRTRLIDKLSTMVRDWQDEPRYAAVYGSAAQGRMRADSDVDVLVVKRDGASDLVWDSQLLDISNRVFQLTGNRAETVVLTEKELAVRIDEPFLRDLRVHALTFAGDRSWFDQQFLESAR